MHILVTGAGGQLGQDLVALCRSEGISCTAADSKALDITDRSRVRRVIREVRPGVIINCAAYNAVDNAEADWHRAFRVNGLALRDIAREAAAIGALLVHYSTDYVFDGASTRPYTIADHPCPLSRYGESKLLGEQMVMSHADRYLLIRVSWVFGKGNMNFARKVIEWSRTLDRLRMATDQRSVPTYTVDLAKATLDLVKNDENGLFHLTNSGDATRYEWAAEILGQMGWKGRIEEASATEFQTAARRPAYSVLDTFGSEDALGYRLPDWRDATGRFLKELEVI